MSACPQCGQENNEGAKFCIKCGTSLGAPAQPAAAPPPATAAAPPPPPAAAPPPATPPQAAQPTYQQPAQYAQPTPPPGTYAQQPYAAPPAAPYPAAYAPAPAYAAARSTRGTAFWVGASIVLLAGILILISTWMPWISGPFGFGDVSGWKLTEGAQGAEWFFAYNDGYPLFTGLCSLLLGGLILLVGALMLLFRSKGLGGVAILFSIFALGIAITNLTSILRGPFGVDLGVGIGMYLFAIFSFLGLVGGGIAMSG